MGVCCCSAWPWEVDAVGSETDESWAMSDPPRFAKGLVLMREVRWGAGRAWDDGGARAGRGRLRLSLARVGRSDWMRWRARGPIAARSTRSLA